GVWTVRRLPYALAMLDDPAVDTPRQEARATFGLAPGAKVTLLIAAVFESPYKGMPLAVEALRQLRPGEAQVLALGPSADQVVRDLPVPVTRPGHASAPPNLAHPYRPADLTLMPSVADNFPYVALESFACRTPIVCFCVGGLT